MKNKYIKPLIIIAFILVLILVTTFSYAYFSASVNKGEVNQTVITSGNMALAFNDGPEVIATDFYPSQSITKTFSVTNTGTVKTDYSIYLSKLINTFVDKNDLVDVVNKMSAILRTIKYNDVILESLVGENVLNYKEEDYTLFKADSSKETFLDVVKKEETEQYKKDLEDEKIDLDY